MPPAHIYTYYCVQYIGLLPDDLAVTRSIETLREIFSLMIFKIFNLVHGRRTGRYIKTASLFLKTRATYLLSPEVFQENVAKGEGFAFFTCVY